MNFCPIRPSFASKKQLDWSKYAQNIRENSGFIVLELTIDCGDHAG